MTEFWKRQMDPNVRKELDILIPAVLKLQEDLKCLGEHDLANRIFGLEQSQKAIEDKLDALLAAIETPEARSNEENGKKPEGLAIAPGYKPWSRRKQERIAGAKSPGFVDKVKKGAATTQPAEDTENAD